MSKHHSLANHYRKAGRWLACGLLVGSAVPQVLVAANTPETIALSTTETISFKPVPVYLVRDTIGDSAVEVGSLVTQGKLTEAIEKLEEAAAKQTEHKEANALRQEAFRLKALKREFSVDAETMLAKIHERLPQATQADLKEWTEKNSLLWIPVDGEIRYFRREPGILFRFDDSVKKRLQAQSGGDPAGRESTGYSATKHMRAALDDAKDQNTSVVLPMRFTASHKVTVKPGTVPPGETIRCWLPYPKENIPQQSDAKILSSSSPGKIAPDTELQRTVYFEQPAADDGSAVFEMEFEYTGAALVVDWKKAKDELSDAEREAMQPYLQPRTPHLELTPQVRELAQKIVGDEKRVAHKAFKIWSWLDENVGWCPEMEYVVMPNIVQKVITEGKGDCGTQGLAFVALCRAVDVPARWQSGWVTPPRAWNMHDWAEFYAPGIGWLPVDPSRGRQKSDDPAVRDFLFGNIDSYRMIANEDHDRDFNPSKKHFRSDPVDNQRGEVEWEGGNIYYDQMSYEVKVTSVPLKDSAE